MWNSFGAKTPGQCDTQQSTKTNTSSPHCPNLLCPCLMLQCNIRVTCLISNYLFDIQVTLLTRLSTACLLLLTPLLPPDTDLKTKLHSSALASFFTPPCPMLSSSFLYLVVIRAGTVVRKQFGTIFSPII